MTKKTSETVCIAQPLSFYGTADTVKLSSLNPDKPGGKYTRHDFVVLLKWVLL